MGQTLWHFFSPWIKILNFQEKPKPHKINARLRIFESKKNLGCFWNFQWNHKNNRFKEPWEVFLYLFWKVEWHKLKEFVSMWGTKCKCEGENGFEGFAFDPLFASSFWSFWVHADGAGADSLHPPRPSRAPFIPDLSRASQAIDFSPGLLNQRSKSAEMINSF